MLQIKLQRKLQSRGKGVREWAPVIVINRDSDWDQVRKGERERESPADQGSTGAKARTPAEAVLPRADSSRGTD